MPFYCGKRSAGICVVLSSKKSSTHSSEYASGFSSLRPRICQRLPRLATKDYSDRLLAAFGTTLLARTLKRGQLSLSPFLFLCLPRMAQIRDTVALVD